MRLLPVYLVCVEVVAISLGYTLPEGLSCKHEGSSYSIGDEVRISPSSTCLCLLESRRAVYIGGCQFTSNKARRQGFPTPPTPAAHVTASTKAPPPFTTLAPPDPGSTNGPADLTTRGPTQAPPPVG